MTVKAWLRQLWVFVRCPDADPDCHLCFGGSDG